MDASFEEKSVWIQLLGTVAILGSYFVVAGRMLAKGTSSVIAFAPLFGVAVALLIVVLVVGHIIVAISRPEGRDERDLLIEWRADSQSSWILSAGVLAAIGGLAGTVATVWIAHLLLLSLLLSEVARFAFQLVYYRRGL